MIVVVIVGLLATMAIPALQRVRLSSQNARFANDLRVFRAAVNHYILETGVYPVDSHTGLLDASMEGYIQRAQFEPASSIGGRWDIEFNDSGVMSAVGVHQPTATTEQLTQIDEMIDDGDIADGRLRFITGDRFYWVLID